MHGEARGNDEGRGSLPGPILAVLHRAVTPEAVREEMDHLTRADRMAGWR